MITKNNVENVFAYHVLNDASVEKMDKVREAAKNFANTILSLTPQCSDQQKALNSVREAMMFANAAIVLDGDV